MSRDTRLCIALLTCGLVGSFSSDLVGRARMIYGMSEGYRWGILFALLAMFLCGILLRWAAKK